jgi:hypothetical protein
MTFGAVFEVDAAVATRTIKRCIIHKKHFDQHSQLQQIRKTCLLRTGFEKMDWL